MVFSHAHVYRTDSIITRDYFQIFAASALVMGISHTIARERLGAPLRDRLGGKVTWLGYLVSCPYCLSHWVAFAIVPLTATYPVRVPYDWGPLAQGLDLLLSAILLAVFAAFLRVAFYYIDETQGLVRRQQRRVEAELPREPRWMR